MSYTTFNIIVKVENEEEELINYLTNNFKFFTVRKFFTPFHGIVCQALGEWKEYPFENFTDNFFNNQTEVENYFSNGIIEKINGFSIKFPEKKISYVEVDCYGGKCTSKGYVIRNNEKIFEQESHHSGHKNIIQKIHPEFNSWFFYPFTRTFFTDRGGLNGEIMNFTLPAIWMSFNMELSSNSDFEINVTENELLVLNRNSFEIYLMSLSQERIKVMGTLFKNDDETIETLKKLLTSNLEGIEHYIEIDNFENGKKYLVSNVGKEQYEKIATESYRKVPFNERNFKYPHNGSNKSTRIKEIFLSKIIKRMFGK